MGSMFSLQDSVGSNTPVAFSFGGKKVTVITHNDGAPWFVAMEVASILGYSDSEAMTRRLDDDEKQNLHIVGFGPRGVTVISEAGLYASILASQKPEAKPFKRWVTHEVLPLIRSTGSYSVADPLAGLPPEQRALVGLMVESAALKKVQAEQAAAITRIEQRVEEAAQAQLMLARPSNAEAVVHIRERINKTYGLPPRIIDTVLRQSLYAPKPAGMVKNSHEDARGSSYAVYWTKDISALFARFVSECEMVTATQATHPLILGRFKLIAGGGQS